MTAPACLRTLAIVLDRADRETVRRLVDRARFGRGCGEKVFVVTGRGIVAAGWTWAGAAQQWANRARLVADRLDDEARQAARDLADRRGLFEELRIPDG